MRGSSIKMSLYRTNKFKHLFQTKEWSDCMFIIDDEKISAHKFLLACSSPVFESMFFGEMASSNIQIEDIESDTFKKTLQYIYTNELKINSVLEAWNLMYAAQKYFLCELENICLEYVKNNISINNLLLSYEYSKLYNQEKLLNKCLDDILMFTKGVLLFSNYHMQAETLMTILKEQRGNMNDMILLTVKWGWDECSVQEIAPSKENVYALLKNLGVLNELKFNEYSGCNGIGFLETLTKEKKFTFDIILDFCESFCNEFSPSLYAKKNNNKSLQFKYRTEYKNSVNLPIDRSEFVCPIAYCNKDCLIFGLVISNKSKSMQISSNNYIGGANIYIYIRHSSNLSRLVFKLEDQRNFLEYNDVQKIVFPVPVLFEAYQKYVICVEYLSENSGNESILLKYMSDKLSRNKNDNAVINFIEEFSGSVLRGVCFYEL